MVWAVGGPAMGGGRGTLVSLPGVQGHTDTGGGGGGVLLSKCHQSPWNRKGWFHSNHHLSDTASWKADRLLDSSWHRYQGLNHK